MGEQAGLVIPPLSKAQKLWLTRLGVGWVGAGAVAAFSWGAACGAEQGVRLSAVNALCAELALFGFVCWNMLGAIAGFTLYYWLAGRNYARTPR